MRVLVVAVVLAASLALAGCSSSQQEPNTAVDPEQAEPGDYARGAIVFVMLVVVVAALVGTVILVRRRRDNRPPASEPGEGKAKGP